MSWPQITVVGNGVAGFACVRELTAAGAAVALIGPGLPCDRPPLSKRALETGMPPYLADRAALASMGVTHLDGWAGEPDVARRVVSVRLRSGGVLEHRFGPLVWATGLAPSRPPIPGIELAADITHPLGLEQERGRIAGRGLRIAVLGAGLIGCETAAALARRHHVVLLERAERPLNRFHPSVSGGAAAALADAGVQLIAGCAVQGLTRSAERGYELHLEGRASLGADLVLTSAGVRSTLPAVLGPDHTAPVDERLRAPGLGDVWVCGDLAAVPHPRYGRIAVPHWDNARASGAHAARSVMGDATPFRREPYWFSDIGRLRVQQVGLAAAAVEWCERDGLTVGSDGTGRPACVLLMNTPQRLAEARRLVAA
jgi:3-phenylpropionate/trans-cinnamate dioxygenase ferredoxin reductase component